MRIGLAIAFLLTALEGTAHTLGTEAALSEEFAHQLTGAHHLPVLILALVVGAVSLGKRLRNSARGKNQPR